MKKVLSLFLCLNIIMMLSPFGVFASSITVPEITSYGFMTVDGKVITTLGGETSIKAYVDIENKNHITSNNLGNLVATCTVDGILVSTTTLQITIEANTRLKRMETNAINVPIDSTNIVFKVFIMDTLQNIRPVVNMYRWGTNPNAVNDGTKYADAIKTVIGLGIMNGYEDGSFHAEGDVTRAEFAAVMVRLLGKESLAQNAIGTTKFSDVSTLHWAYGYINLATMIFNMSGYEDGRFGPDNNMTFDIATKALVIALGYEPTVEESGNPLAYLLKAKELGITYDISLIGTSLISRGVLAKLVANSLDVPLLCQTGYGTNITYYVQDGYIGTERKTILSEYRNLVKLQVVVNSYDGFSSNSNDVKVTILNNYRTKYSDEFVSGYGLYTLDAGTSNVIELVGRKAIVYVAYDYNSSDTPVVTYAYKDTTNSEELTILGDNIEAATSFGSNVTVAYWANSTDKATTNIVLPTTAKLYYNGDIKYGAVLTTELAKGKVYGSVSFVKNNTATTQDFDTVFITNYTNFVVNTVSASTFRVISKNAGSISFNSADTSVKSILYDTTGKQMNWSDLKEWDVVSCKVVNGYSKKVTVGTLVNNKVTGQIVEIESGTTMAKDKFTINSNVYKIDPVIVGMLALADQGTFYLDILGKICWFKVGVIVITPTPTPTPTVTPTVQTPATVVGTGTGLNASGDTINTLKVLQDGMATTIYGDSNFSSKPLIGTTIIPVKNEKSEVKSITSIAVPNSANNIVDFTTPYNTANVNYTYGLVTERINNIITTTGGEFVVPSTANVYIYDERSSSSANRVTTGDITDFDAKIATPIDVANGLAVTVGSTFYESMGDQIAKIYAIAREYDGKIIDVVIYIFK